ncbi:AAA family ATPase [Tsukamurella hominis]
MSIINQIRVTNFRSIKDAQISPLSGYESIVGLNSAGKSNLLRALKLFFTGSVDETGSGLDVDRDYSDYGPQKPRRIKVGVSFPINSGIKFPRQADFLERQGLVDNLAICQTWYRDSQTRGITREFSYGQDLDNLAPATDPADISSLESFIRSIEFRYVPNHAQPSELIRQYVQPLRSALVTRLRNTKEYRSSDVGELLLAMSRLADTLFEDVATAVSKGISGRTLKSALPTDFADLAFDLAIRSIDPDGHARSPELEGSGTQQFMFLHLLNLADRTARGAGFGWLQGHIWAIEEPESFLHAGLRQRYATDLFAYSDDPRRQIFLTTHQDEFVRVGDSAIVARTSASGTIFNRLTPKLAIEQSNKEAVTAYRHPLLQYSDQPLVLVEGKFDAQYIRQGLDAAGIKPRWRLADPDDLTGDATGGDAFKQYLRYNSAAIKSRPDSAPILVVRDWETNDANSYRTYLKGHRYSTVVTMPSDLCTSELGTGWSGIERYLPLDFVESMVPEEDLLRRSNGVIEPEKSSLNSHKQAMARAFDIAEHPGANLISLAKWIDERVSEMLAEVPTEAFF